MFEYLRRLLGHADRPQMQYDASSMSFLQLKTEEIREDMRLEVLGQRKGEEQEPPSDITSYDNTEREILDRIESERGKSNQAYLNQMTALLSRANAFDLSREVANIRTEADGTITQFRVLGINVTNRLQAIIKDLQTRKDDLNDFQRRHGLARSILTKSGPLKVLAGSFMLLLFVGETIFNGSMLARGLQFGLVQVR